MERNYNQVFEIEKRRGSGIKKFFIATLIILLVFIIVYFVTMMGVFGKNYDIKKAAISVFGVSIKKSETLEDLQNSYLDSVIKGASGYIWQSQQVNYMLALIYPSIDMANSVVAMNEGNSFGLEVVEFYIDGFQYDLDEFDIGDVEVVQNTIDYIFSIVQSLYDLTISYHTGSITKVASASNINSIKGELMVYESKLNDILSKRDSEKLKNLREFLIKSINLLDKTVTDLLSSNNSENGLKYSYCEYVYNLASMPR